MGRSPPGGRGRGRPLPGPRGMPAIRGANDVQRRNPGCTCAYFGRDLWPFPPPLCFCPRRPHSRHAANGGRFPASHDVPRFVPHSSAAGL
jgi:hypothetical protein